MKLPGTAAGILKARARPFEAVREQMKATHRGTGNHAGGPGVPTRAERRK